MRKLSRLEANKNVRRILNRHGTDLSYTQYSVAGMDIRLTGWLCKTDCSDFNAGQIESLIQEFQRLLPGYSVSGDFDNWNFTTDHITFLGDKKKGNNEEDTSFLFENQSSDYDSEAS
jgi:hypothetical protein